MLVTHRHRDHLDGTAERLLPRDVPTFCQPDDASALYDLGLDVRPIDDALDWNGLELRRVPGRHGSGAIAEALAPVSGFVLGELYLAGDTVWYDDVADTIDRFSPRVAIVNAGGASFLEGGLIVMGIDDVREVASRVPVVVCVHMEALNHCHLSRADLAAAVPGVVIPGTARPSRCKAGTCVGDRLKSVPHAVSLATARRSALRRPGSRASSP